MAPYSFVTVWYFPAPREQVWQALTATEYSLWWPNVLGTRVLTPPEVTGVGVRLERRVRGRLPYTLRYVTTTTHHDPPNELAYDSVGELAGRGRMVLADEDGGTRVTWYWDVATTGFWMNLLAPLLRPVFAWNHHQVMAAGERGLRDWLRRQMAPVRDGMTG
jgi:hypothetical protein